MHTVLVTGGAGYIGSHIVDLLCELDYNVFVLDNLANGYKENINSRAKFVYGDIRSKVELDNFFSKHKIDSIVHMSALKATGESMINSAIYSNNNIIGSINLITAAIKFKVKKFIFSSSAAVYGQPKYSPIDELHPTNPINYYGYTKLFIENYLSWSSLQGDINYIVLRYFNAAGYSKKKNLCKNKEKNPQNLLPIIMEVANGSRKILKVFGNDYPTYDGTCIRDYINVVDLADAHLKALDYLDEGKSCCLNLSSGTGYSVLDVIKISEIVTARKIIYSISKRRMGDPAILISTNENARKKLKWNPANSDLKEIIKSMWAHYKN